MDVDTCWGASGWPQLPADLLQEVARRAAGADDLAEAKTLLRLVCRSWHVALPIGARVLGAGCHTLHPHAGSMPQHACMEQASRHCNN